MNQTASMIYDWTVFSSSKFFEEIEWSPWLHWSLQLNNFKSWDPHCLSPTCSSTPVPYMDCVCGLRQMVKVYMLDLSATANRESNHRLYCIFLLFYVFFFLGLCNFNINILVLNAVSYDELVAPVPCNYCVVYLMPLLWCNTLGPPTYPIFIQ